MANFTKNIIASSDLDEVTNEENRANVKPRSLLFDLANGFVRYKPKEQQVLEDGKKEQEGGYFLFCNHNMTTPIRLYSRQVQALVKHLPTAYCALKEGDTSYCLVVAINKAQRITLEVNLYNDNYYLFLKKCFKPEDKVDDPQQDWIYTRSSLLFDTKTDDPTKLQDFILSCYQ